MCTTPHPLVNFLLGWLEDWQITVTSFPSHVETSRVILSRLVNGRWAISADMNLRLSEALGPPGHWLALQQQRDLWTAQQLAKKRKRIKPLTP